MNWNRQHPPSNEINFDCVALTDYRLIRVCGVDAEAFLQSQCTPDFTQLQNRDALLGAHCTHKGRMHSSFLTARISSDCIALRVHQSIAANALQALQKYAIFSKVALSLSEDHTLIGILGPDAALVAQNFGSVPKCGKFQLNDNSVTICHAEDQVELWCTADSAITATLQHTKVPIQSDTNLWRLKNIRRGIADVEANTAEKLIPQEINFHLVGGISFNKGCYTGQEIVARLHYRGQLKKHMYRAYVNGESEPQPGMSILEHVESKRARGMVINSARSETSGYEFLALCDGKLVDTDTCVVESDYSAKIQWKPLPYAIS